MAKTYKPYPHMAGNLSGKHKQQGFSLIEFAIASVLSMMVLVAVSSGYFTARQLNTAADTRLKFQQDLRNAANMIVRDARMAGSFGCVNLLEVGGERGIKKDGVHDNNVQTSALDAFKLIKYDDSNQKLMPVRLIEKAYFSPHGFAPSSDALVFVYGSGTGSREQVAADKPMVFSSCKVVLRPPTDTLPDDNTLKAELGVDDSQKSEIMYMNYIVNAYVTGEINGQKGLFRFQLDGNDWGNPQLLAAADKECQRNKDCQVRAEFNYTYINGCPRKEILPQSSAGFETFEYNSKLSRLPALIQMGLKIENKRNPNASVNSKISEQTYDIKASVRGEDSCANTL